MLTNISSIFLTSVTALSFIATDALVPTYTQANAQQAQGASSRQDNGGFAAVTRYIIEPGTEAQERRILEAEPGDRIRISAPRTSRGARFSHWEGDTRVLRNPNARAQNITVRRTRSAIRLIPIYRNGPTTDVRIAISGQAPIAATPGETIAVRARNVEGQEFLRWEGAIQHLDNAREQTTTLTVPDSNIALRPVYRPERNRSQQAGGGSQASGGNRRAAQNNGGSQASGGNSRVTQSGGRIRIISHTGNDTIRRQGDTLVGSVNNPREGQTITASIGNIERETEVDAETGRFVIRLDSEQLERNRVTVDLELSGPQSGSAETTFSAGIADDTTGLTNVLSRVTYGATPGLYAFLSSGNTEQRVRNYIRDQLNAPNNRNALLRNLEIDNFAARGFNRNGNPLQWKIGYALYSDNQLREVMTEFWDNHFFTLDFDSVTDIRDIRGFRANAFGNFRDLLEISATSPSMMQYLNNTSNFRDNINENYGRELLELHTLGQDAGYGPDDVIAVARVLTGWTRRQATANNRGRFEGEFAFIISRHDQEDKVIPFLNTTIRGRRGEEGFEEGQELLDILANHPATRRFVCGKLVQRFVADSKPQKYVNACVRAWAETEGNMGEALEAILLHPDYGSDVELQRTKAKTPYEAILSLMRAFNLFPIEDEVNLQAAQNPFFRNIQDGAIAGGYRRNGTPDGNPEEAEEWIGTGSLIQAMRFTIRNIEPSGRVGSLGSSDVSRFDTRVFIDGAKAPTAEGVADYMLTLATADSHKADELEEVAEALRGNAGFDPSNRGRLQASLRRAMTVIATLPNSFIQ